MRRGPGGVGAINRQRLAKVSKCFTLYISITLIKKVQTFGCFSSGKVCDKGNRNSRYPALSGITVYAKVITFIRRYECLSFDGKFRMGDRCSLHLYHL